MRLAASLQRELQLAVTHDRSEEARGLDVLRVHLGGEGGRLLLGLPATVVPGRIESVSVAWYTSERKLDARKTTAASTREMTRIRSQFSAMTRKCVARSMAGHVRGATPTKR